MILGGFWAATCWHLKLEIECLGCNIMMNFIMMLNILFRTNALALACFAMQHSVPGMYIRFKLTGRVTRTWLAVSKQFF